MKTKNCKSCQFFKVVYEYCGYRFMYSLMYSDYYCTESEQLIDCKSICEKWQAKKTEYNITLQRLKEVEEDIKALIECLSRHSE